MNLRCYYHGGAPGTGAQPGNQNALKHGRYTAEAIKQRALEGQLLTALNDGIAEVLDRIDDSS